MHVLLHKMHVSKLSIENYKLVNIQSKHVVKFPDIKPSGDIMQHATYSHIQQAGELGITNSLLHLYPCEHLDSSITPVPIILKLMCTVKLQFIFHQLKTLQQMIQLNSLSSIKCKSDCSFRAFPYYIVILCMYVLLEQLCVQLSQSTLLRFACQLPSKFAENIIFAIRWLIIITA